MTSKRRGETTRDAPLPVRFGVAPSRVHLPRGTWPTLLDFLLERFKHIPADILRARLERGDIVDQDGTVQTLASPYRALRWLWYYREVPDEESVPFDLPVLFRDDFLVVADKPHFLASTPGGRYLQETALIRLRSQLDLPLLSPLHRLDRDTAGVLLFSTNPQFRGAYQSLFQHREVQKVYEAVAPLRDDLDLPMVYRSRLEPRASHFTMHETPGAANSETHIELIGNIARREGLGHYRLRPHTGRKHQLRVHMSALGIPICNDGFYPELQAYADAGDFSSPLQLIARTIEFKDPYSGGLRRFESLRRLAYQEEPGVA